LLHENAVCDEPDSNDVHGRIAQVLHMGLVVAAQLRCQTARCQFYCGAKFEQEVRHAVAAIS
jgi:hypothetical protein